MKKNTVFMCLSLGLAGLLSSCSSFDNPYEPKEISSEKGLLTLNLASGVEFVATTRAVDESAYQDFDNYQVEITDKKGNSKFSGSFATLKTRLPLELELGSYDITASYGTEEAASRETFLAKGSNTVTIQSSNQSSNPASVNVNCTPTAGKVVVAFDSSITTYCDNYSVDFTTEQLSNAKKVAYWGKADTEPWYFAVKEEGESVSYTIHLTTKAEYAASQDGEKVTEATATGSFKLERNKTKKLTVKGNYTPSTEGGITISITIDEGTSDKPITIEVPVTWTK